MVVIAALVLVVGVVVAAVVLQTRSRSGTSPDQPLSAKLAAWLELGLIDEQQAERIAAYEAPAAPAAVLAPLAPAAPAGVPVPLAPAAVSPAAAPAPGPHRRPALFAMIEVLGYIGGALAVTGVVLLVAHFWADLALVGQLALSGLTAAALVGAGLAVPERRDAAMARLRAFLWTLATAAVAVAAAIAATELLGSDPAGPVVACTAAAVAVTSGLMWRGRSRPVQQLVALVAAVLAVGTGLAEPTGPTIAGLAVWVAGAGLVAVGVRRLTTIPVLEVVVGAIAVGVGSFVAIGDDPGVALVFVVASGAALVTLALLRHVVSDVASIVALCVIGGITIFQSLPPLVAIMAEDAALATGATLWAAGLAVTLIGVKRLTRTPIVLEVLGAVTMLVACAVVAVESPGVATISGLLASLALLGVSMLRGRVALSPVGAVGLLAFVPWAIGWYFPGEGRVPLLISVSGLLIIGVAVLMARSGHRFTTEL